MNDETLDPEKLFDFLVEEGSHRQDPEDHPSPETLTAYQANELSPEEDERIQGHLAACRHCTEMLLELEEFLQPSEAAAPTADFTAATDRLRLGERMTGETAIQFPGRRRQEIRLSPLAASLSLVLLLGSLGGFSWWNLALRSKVIELQAPRLVDGPIRLEGTRGDTLQASGEEMRDFELVSSHPTSFPKYQVEITTEDGQVLWSKISPKGRAYNPHLILTPGFLSPGLYHIRLSGIQGKQLELLETYTLRIGP